MIGWLADLDRLGEAPCVLVTVARAEGSVPREAGTKMIVTSNEQFGTVGGGHLEFKTVELARELLAKNPVVLRAAKLGYKHCAAMSWDQAEDYLYAKLEQSQFLDAERGREQGLEQFLDEKRIKPGLQAYERPTS